MTETGYHCNPSPFGCLVWIKKIKKMALLDLHSQQFTPLVLSAGAGSVHLPKAGSEDLPRSFLVLSPMIFCLACTLT